MRMKKIGSIALGLAFLGLASCATDTPDAPAPQGPSVKDTYATITISLPSGGTRAEGDEEDVDSKGIYTGDGSEVGQDYENQVGKILVVLAEKQNDEKYTLLTYAISDSKQVTGTSEIKYVLNFSSAELRPEVPGDKLNGAGDLSGLPVYVFTYCNPTSNLETLVKSWKKGDDISNLEGTIAATYANTEIWQKNKFLMTNVETVEVTYLADDGETVIKGIPSREKLVSEHNTANTAFNLGTVDVIRAAARFDFQASNGEGLELNQYQVLNVDGETSIGIVELTHMAAFNIATSYYYLPRTNTLWTWGGQTTLCSGKDNNTNAFVMSPNETIKKTPMLSEQELSKIFWAALNDPTAYSWTSLKDWNKRDLDYDDANWPSAGTDYRIWRYVPENTIPGWGGSQYNEGSQRAGITTGVVFRASFIPTDKALWNGNAVYIYNNTIYGDLNALKEYVAAAPETEVAQAFKQVQQFGVEDPDLKVNLVANADDNHGFSAYVPNANGGYDMYYYYYNRHKTNGINTTLGVNEFGVVRNNVYKLKVTKINSLGLPTPPDPNTEDEEENVFFTVDVRVLPWVVRINDIEF